MPKIGETWSEAQTDAFRKALTVPVGEEIDPLVLGFDEAEAQEMVRKGWIKGSAGSYRWVPRGRKLIEATFALLIDKTFKLPRLK